MIRRGASFALVIQNNLQLRGAAVDVAIARAQLAQAQGSRLPQVTLSTPYTRNQEHLGQVLSFPNPRCQLIDPLVMQPSCVITATVS